MEPTLFGIGKAEWELYNSFSNWVSAIATLAAVLVSLHLARRAGQPRASVSVGHRVIITPGETSAPEVIVFTIVNTGDRPIRVTQIGWRVGLWSKRYAMQMHDPKLSSPMPIELTHGQEAHWTIPLDLRSPHWFDHFTSKVLKPNPWLSLRTIRAQFKTSVGEVFSTRPERGLIEKMRNPGQK